MNQVPRHSLIPKDPFGDICGRSRSGRSRRSIFTRISRFVLFCMIAVASGGAGIALQSYFYFTQNLPSIEKLKNYNPSIVSQVYSDDGQIIAEFAKERRFVTPIDRIPKLLQDAFISAEDKNFRTHVGVDGQAIVRAAKTNLLHPGTLVGASTITQQVAKTFLLTSERKFSRKIKEAILATRMEQPQALSKDHILYLYLNQIYLGGSAYGVQAAAQVYFDKDVKDLTIAECAMLAGLPKAPSTYSPKSNLKGSVERRSYVLRRMQEDGYISEAEYEAANQEEPCISTKQYPVQVKTAADFTSNVKAYVERKYGANALFKDGLQVYTTVDLELTKAAHSAMGEGLRELDKREGYRGPIKTLTAKEIVDFLDEKGLNSQGLPRFGQITEGVITQIDSENIYVRMGTFERDGQKKDYVGQIKIDTGPKWWVRTPFIRPELRKRNYVSGDLPFQVGDLILVRVLDPNAKRRELYVKKYGKTDPEMKNYKEYTEDMVPQFALEVEQEPVAQSALMMRENRSGYVRVLLGGNGSGESKYNRATQAKRQAGSSFKPAIYAAALNKGFSAADIILDSPLALTVPGTGEVWRPKNYRGGFQGPVSFRQALVKSINIPTIKILQQIGIEHAKSYARRLGYTSPMVDNLTLALGSTGVSLEEQICAYSVFPSRGYAIPNIYIKKIVDRNGRVLEQHDPPALLDDPVQSDLPRVKKAALNTSSDSEPDRGTAYARRAIDEATSYIMCTLLQGVIQEGTATNLKKIVERNDIAGKTGTTNDTIDAWFMGFSPDYTCGVWVGFDDEYTIGDGETGGKAAAPIWGYFMKEVLKGKPVKDFNAPPNIEFRKVDPKTGLVTSAGSGIQEVFKVGAGATASESKLIKGSGLDYPGSDLDQF